MGDTSRLRPLSSAMSQSSIVSSDVLLTLFQHAKLQMQLFCAFQILSHIDDVTSFFFFSLRTLRTSPHAVDLVSLEIPSSQQRSSYNQTSDVFFEVMIPPLMSMGSRRFLTDVV